jgi:hypothetical protein
MTQMSVDDAIRVAQIFEADDIISVPAMACRILLKEIERLNFAAGYTAETITIQADEISNLRKNQS